MKGNAEIYSYVLQILPNEQRNSFSILILTACWLLINVQEYKKYPLQNDNQATEDDTDSSSTEDGNKEHKIASSAKYIYVVNL